VHALTVGPDGMLYVTQAGSVLKVNPTSGVVTTVITYPNGTCNGDVYTYGIAADSQRLYVQVSTNNVCGNYTVYQLMKLNFDGTGNTQLANDPNLGMGMLESAGSYLYSASKSGAVRRYTKSDGTWRDVAGAGTNGNADGIGADAWFSGGPRDIASDGTNLYLVDGGNRLRKVTSSTPLPTGQQPAVNTATAITAGAVSTVAGSGSAVSAAGTGTAASFNAPRGVVVAGGYAYVAGQDAISKVELATGVTSLLAGAAGSTGCTNSSTGVNVRLSAPLDMASDGYFAYTIDNTCGLRRVSLTTGAASTIVSAAALGVNANAWSYVHALTVGPDGML